MRDGLIKHLSLEKIHYEQILREAQQPGFKIMEIRADGRSVDMTAQYIEDVQRAINEFQRTIEYLMTDE